MNPQSQHAKNYFRTRVMTATREQLQMMLFDGAVRFATQARTALEKKDYEASYSALTRTQHIVSELLSTLDHKQDPELCAKLAGLYNYVFRNLVQANVSREVAPLDDALKILQYQRDTWALLMQNMGGAKEGDAPTKTAAAAPTARMEPTLSVTG